MLTRCGWTASNAIGDMISLGIWKDMTAINASLASCSFGSFESSGMMVFSDSLPTGRRM